MSAKDSIRKVLFMIRDAFPDANLSLVAVGLGAETAIEEDHVMFIRFADGSEFSFKV